MLKNIRFCYCSRLDDSPENESQCMIFSFTDRAIETLGDTFIANVSYQKEFETGIPIGKDEDGEDVCIKIERIEENVYRVPTRFIEAFMRVIFNYLPAYYQSPAERVKNKCCCSHM